MFSMVVLHKYTNRRNKQGYSQVKLLYTVISDTALPNFYETGQL